MPAQDPARGDYSALPAVNLPRALWVEVCGTYFLVLAGTAVAVSAALARPIAGAPNNSLAVGLTFGLTLVALVAALGFLSGAHFNPAVTLGLASAGKFPWKDTAQYIIAQLVGAILASLTVWLVFGNAARSIAFLGATYPAPTASAAQAFLIEAVVTFFLVMTVVAVTTDKRVPAPVAAPAIGFALGMAVLIAGPISGGAVNPARALGPMIVTWKFDSVWVYILGPLIGGMCAGLLYPQMARTSAPSVTVKGETHEQSPRRKAA